NRRAGSRGAVCSHAASLPRDRPFGNLHDVASEPTPPLSVRGDLCFADTSTTPHVIESPDDDADLMVVYAWLRSHDLRRLFTRAVISTIDYVLDGARTGRFDIQAPEVDSDERRTVGTKLQYHVLEALDLVKEPP